LCAVLRRSASSQRGEFAVQSLRGEGGRDLSSTTVQHAGKRWLVTKGLRDKCTGRLLMNESVLTLDEKPQLVCRGGSRKRFVDASVFCAPTEDKLTKARTALLQIAQDDDTLFVLDENLTNRGV
jgi:hypothetical protein